MLKENIRPWTSNRYLTIYSPMWILYITIIIWILIPLNYKLVLVNIRYSILLWLAINSIGIYGIWYPGWSSNSKYGILGTLRGISQLLSYEISMGIVIMCILIGNHTIDFHMFYVNQKYISNIFVFWPLFLLFFINGLAEINRHPFDLLEAESELVAGSIVEYAGASFALIYIAEYLHVIILAFLINILFIGNIFTFFIFVYLIVLIRGSLPRLRYDQLIYIGWNLILPISLSLLIFYISLYSLF
jgi:NADH-quinone oxidoreductase subunit H